MLFNFFFCNAVLSHLYENSFILIDIRCESILDWIPILGYYAHRVDPVQMPQNVASDQDLFCLLTKNSMQNTVKG